MKLVLILIITIMGVTCYAQTFYLDNLTYDETLKWAKADILARQNKGFSNLEIMRSLIVYPTVSFSGCGIINLMMIENPLLSGNVNASYYIFSGTTSDVKSAHYQYLGLLSFSAQRLFCFDVSSKKKYYFITSQHESNSVGLLNLYELQRNKMIRIKSVKVDYSNKRQADFAESLWEAKVTAKQIFNGFHIPPVDIE